MPAIKPARIDQSLLEAFQKAVEGKGDGRVSKADVEQLIAPRIADGRKLTETEKATLAWAVEEFRLTDAAKRSLSDDITALTGQPVFEWQRQLGGPVGVRLGDAKTQKELDQAATLEFSRHTHILQQGYDDDAMYYHPESGNAGTHVIALEGAEAEKLLKLMAHVHGQPDLLDKVSTSSHAVYSVYESDDEEHFGAIFVDRKTGEALALDTYNIVDLGYDLNREQFESIFGELKDADGRRVPDSDFEDAMYEVDVGEHIGRNGRDVPLLHYAPDQVKRREEKLDKASRALRDVFDRKATDRKAEWDYGVAGKSVDEAIILPLLIEAAQDADWHDKAKAGASPAVTEPFRAFDQAAKASLLASMQAVDPGVTEAQVDALVAGLGRRADVRFAVAELPMTVKGFGGGAEEEFTAKAHLLWNPKEGDWLAFYDRPRVQGD